ncbi:hypothetical protein Fmac_008884 [Flemingia macrophylla]|uniref:Uncharacterized protein n=1 Tax=Flemingia macrophylla TaxID=520843 RepID=A0ABD1MYP7_9FABA
MGFPCRKRAPRLEGQIFRQTLERETLKTLMRFTFKVPSKEGKSHGTAFIAILVISELFIIVGAISFSLWVSRQRNKVFYSG